MNLKLKFILPTVLMMVTGCSTYSEKDYADPNLNENKSLCINMEPSQEIKCKERENSLQIGLGADKNCNHPYEYEKNRCKREQAEQNKALADSLKKHTDR